MGYLEAGGHRLHFDWATGFARANETVVYLHDGLGSTGAWKEVPERISKKTGTNALLYDRWGYGGSDPRPEFHPGFMEAEVPALLHVVRQQVGGPVHLVGHSDGGSIALLFACEHPRHSRNASWIELS